MNSNSDQFLNPNRLLGSSPDQWRIAGPLYESVCDLPIISPHGHTDPAWFAENQPFDNASELFLTPDHYVLRMLCSQGISYDALGVPRLDGSAVADPRSAWRLFAENYHLFIGTPSRLWIDHSLNWAFDLNEPLSAANADTVFDQINERLGDEDLRPRAVLDRANVEYIATTEFALDPLNHHAKLAQDGLNQRITTTYRPDDVTDPEHPHFHANMEKLAELTDQDVMDWQGMIEAHRIRRQHFRQHGASATDHGVPSAATADLPLDEKQALLSRVMHHPASPRDAELFRAQMLTEMAGLSCEDGMVMQIHAGVRRNTDLDLIRRSGANLGADIPTVIDAVGGLQPLLNRHGHNPDFNLLIFCLDEAVYARELAPLAGYWPCLRLGPPWWFHDSPRGIARYLDGMVETAGFFNLAGFNDDTRALLSIPARHDVWRRCVSAFLADMIGSGLLGQTDAEQIAHWLCYGAAKQAYRLG